MPKQPKPTIPPLRIDPQQEQSTKQLLKRMRGESDELVLDLDTNFTDTSHTENLVARHKEELPPSHQNRDTPSHIVEQDPSHNKIKESSHTWIQQPSLSLLQTPRHTEPSETRNQALKESIQLETPKPRSLDTPKSKKLDTKKGVSSHTGDRHATREGQVNIQPDFTLLKEIRHFLVDHGLTMREFFEYAARTYIDIVSSKIKEGVSSDQALNDLMTIFKASEDIIRLYNAYTSNRWKLHDDDAAHQFNDVDIRYVEIGIINTMLRFKGKRINSFKYFVPEIEEALAVKLGEETIQIMLKRRRQQWDEKREKK